MKNLKRLMLTRPMNISVEALSDAAVLNKFCVWQTWPSRSDTTHSVSEINYLSIA